MKTIEESSQPKGSAAYAVRSARGRKGITGAELARQTGLSKSGITRIEAGQREPTLSSLVEISRVCGGRFTINAKGVRYVS